MQSLFPLEKVGSMPSFVAMVTHENCAVHREAREGQRPHAPFVATPFVITPVLNFKSVQSIVAFNVSNTKGWPVLLLAELHKFGIPCIKK